MQNTKNSWLIMGFFAFKKFDGDKEKTKCKKIISEKQKTSAMAGFAFLGFCLKKNVVIIFGLNNKNPKLM